MAGRMASRKPRNAPHTLGPAESAVYELVARGGVTTAHAALYRAQLDALEAAGLVKQTAKGYEAQGQALPPPKPVPMTTLVLRVPEAVLDALDAKIAHPGETRSDVARAILMKGLGMAPIPTGPGKRLPSVRRR